MKKAVFALTAALLAVLPAVAEEVTFVAEMTGVTWGGCKRDVSSAFKSLDGVKNVKIEAGEKPGTQKVLVITDGSAELSKRDAVKSLGSNAAKYVVKDWNLDGSAAEESKPKEDKTMKSNLLAEEQDWTNTSGKTITAAVQKVESGKVYFLMDGKVIPYEVTKLSPETIAKLKELMK